MTNEQAKSELMQIYMSLSEEKKQALDVLMAQADGEYISRQAVKEQMIKYGFHAPDMTVTEFVEDIPTVAIPSAEPKTGHWEWVQYDSNPNIGNWHCSECRTIIPHMPEETDNTPIYKWCPMCGAKMVEPQESEDKE